MNKRKLLILFVPTLVVVAIDQITKQWVRTTPSVQNWDIIPGWLAFHYTQNPGMALGMSWASTPVISVIAILATIGILVYILRTLPRATPGYLLCMGLILGGAFGNIIDRMVMAVVEGYGGVLDGHVIDFIHFNLEIGGYAVFPYIFNVADISISTAIISLLVFNRRILPQEEEDGILMSVEGGEAETANIPSSDSGDTKKSFPDE